MFEGKIKISQLEIPRTLLGTSPFIAAPHFGHRARLYQLDFYNNPENILEIIKTSYNLGITGIQVIPYSHVIETLVEAQETGYNMDIMGTVRQGRETEDIELFSDLHANSMLLHADVTDNMDWNFIEEKLQLIKDEKSVAGLVTHMPFKITAKLLKSPILDLFDLYMVPVNKLGYLMDCDTYGIDERTDLNNMIKSLKKTVIAKKVLAAGILQPKEAFDYLKTTNFVDIVTIGIASVKEAEETFNLLASQ
ncbi:MAG: hypothetical protein PHY59_04080 [Methanobacterium sp.]|nr:hypothetical protein [Methanobacterium sp.]